MALSSAHHGNERRKKIVADTKECTNAASALEIELLFFVLVLTGSGWTLVLVAAVGFVCGDPVLCRLACHLQSPVFLFSAMFSHFGELGPTYIVGDRGAPAVHRWRCQTCWVAPLGMLLCGKQEAVPFKLNGAAFAPRVAIVLHSQQQQQQ